MSLIDDRITIRQWDQLKYHDPAQILRRIRKLRGMLDLEDVRANHPELRNELRALVEGQQIALLCHGLSETTLGSKIHFALCEGGDTDAVALWQRPDANVRTPVQVKQAVRPDDVQAIVESLAKYKSPRLVVGIHVSGEGVLRLPTIDRARLNISQIWMFGATSPDQNEWILIGDLLHDPSPRKFRYPDP
jgi:hypothetical protein